MRVLRPRLWVGRLDKIMATRKRHTPEQVGLAADNPLGVVTTYATPYPRCDPAAGFVVTAPVKRVR